MSISGSGYEVHFQREAMQASSSGKMRTSSRRRVISSIQDLAAALGQEFPVGNGRRVPDATTVVDGET